MCSGCTQTIIQLTFVSPGEGWLNPDVDVCKLKMRSDISLISVSFQ